MPNFWDKLNKQCQKEKRPILVLAPMAGLTDSPFRQICKDLGADVVYSEMASTTALVYNPRKTLEMLVSAKSESPYIIQLFGSNLDHFAQAVKLLSDAKLLAGLNIKNLRKPDGFDINFGCPAKKVQKQNAGAVLMNDLNLAKNIIITTIKNTDLPVSIKCRSQVGDVSVLKFLDEIKKLDIKAVMIHGRNLKQLHSGPVDFKIIKEARKYFKGIILANGGVKDLASAKKLWQDTGADGIGIGQAAIGHPWIFSEIKNLKFEIDTQRKNKIIKKHAKLVYDEKGNKGIVEMRKHLCAYAKGDKNARKIREGFIKAASLKDIDNILG